MIKFISYSYLGEIIIFLNFINDFLVFLSLSFCCYKQVIFVTSHYKTQAFSLFSFDSNQSNNNIVSAAVSLKINSVTNNSPRNPKQEHKGTFTQILHCTSVVFNSLCSLNHCPFKSIFPGFYTMLLTTYIY